MLDESLPTIRESELLAIQANDVVSILVETIDNDFIFDFQIVKICQRILWAFLVTAKALNFSSISE